MLLGIPALNEEDTIAGVTAGLAAGGESLSRISTVLCLADGGSVDQTVERFLATPSRLPKVVLSVAGRGKGNNIRAMFEYALSERFDGVVSVDADLIGVPAQWTHAFAVALANGANMVVGRYARVWNDANMSNHIAVPTVLASTGVAIREPIGGDFAVSHRFIESVLARGGQVFSGGFGIDLQLLQHALDIGRLSEVVLDGGKNQGWRAGTTSGIRADMTAKIDEVITAASTIARRGSWPPPSSWRSFAAPGDLDRSRARVADPGRIQAVAEDALLRLKSDRPNLGVPLPSQVAAFSTEDWANALARRLMAPWDRRQRAAFQDLFFVRIAETQGRLGKNDEEYKREAGRLAIDLASARAAL